MSSQQFNYGGQALIEGVMMRGSRRCAAAVRAPSGEIILHDEPINSPLYSGVWSRVPFVRGLGMLWDSLGLGMRALTFSADVAAGDEAEFSGPLAWGTMAISLVIFLGIFFLGPAAAADALHRLLNFDSAFLGNIIEGLIRLGLILGYMWLIGRIPDMQRVFAYHGAEHKTINAYEDGAPLTPESVAHYPREHPRCGTGFLLVVVVISVLVFALLGRPNILVRLGSRIVLIPVIVGIAYEYIRFTAKHMSSPIVRLLVVPQLALQRLTTREPSLDMLEVGISALRCVLDSENLPVPSYEPAPAEAR
ncbi:MAG: DUF1385 domain-containing protein [Chloroflexota bacterium]